MSTLRANGHLDAGKYPVGTVWDEAEMLAKNTNRLLASQALLTQMAVSSLFSKKGASEFKKRIEGLTED